MISLQIFTPFSFQFDFSKSDILELTFQNPIDTLIHHVNGFITNSKLVRHFFLVLLDNFFFDDFVLKNLIFMELLFVAF